MIAVELVPQPTPEEEIYGTGVIVLDANRPGLYVVKEKHPKRVSTRQKDQWSIPLETAKIMPDGLSEHPDDTLLAAMGELICDENLTQGREHFHLAYKEDQYQQSATSPEISYRSAIVVYDGPVTRFTPTATHEVATPRVTPIGKMTDSNSARVRPLAREIVIAMLASGLIEHAYANYRDRKVAPLFPKGFSLSAHQERRDHMQDHHIVYVAR